MQSRNILWLGLLFVLLLTVFCITRFIDNFNPKIKNVAAPAVEIIDEMNNSKALNAPIYEAEVIIPPIQNTLQTAQKSIDTIPSLPQPSPALGIKRAHEKELKKPKTELPKAKEMILAQQILQNSDHSLTAFERYQLEKIIQILKRDPSAILLLQAPKGIKHQESLAYFKKNKIPNKQIQLKSIYDKELDTIKIKVIKKD